MRRQTLALSLLAGVVGVALLACDDDNDDAPARASADAGIDRVAAQPRVGAGGPAPGPPQPFADAACGAVSQIHAIAGQNHVPEGTALSFTTNPPSSGDHYGRWANFQEYTSPVPDGYLVHAMEHGAVVLLYTCDGAACDPIVAGLRAVRDSVETDPLCSAAIRLRIIVAPRPGGDSAVAAAAWGATYKASCVDPPSLGHFIRTHYARGPENFCVPGTYP